ncbi:MAG: diaminopimelate decarboxylase [Candidatus Nitrosomirales archaeon]|jgi:diaminopimelate decarboxylase
MSHSFGELLANLPEFDIVNNELSIQGHLVTELASKYETPLYVYDGNIVQQNLSAVRTAFNGFKIFYSIKANPNPTICKLLAHNQCGADVSSGGELSLALKTGFKPKDIIFVGPGKTDKEIEYALSCSIGTIVAESTNELKRIEKIATKMSKVVDVMVRINTSTKIDCSPVRMVGGPSQFGIDEEDAIAQLKDFHSSHVILVGIHVYSASQILDASALFRMFESILDTAKRISNEVGLDLKIIDMGGGFGISYSQDEKALDISKLGAQVHEAIIRHGIDMRRTSLALELGRFLVGRAGIFLTKVIDVKESRKKTFVITDGGINFLMRPAFYKLNYPTFVVNKIKEKPSRKCTVVGPLCTPFDQLATDIELPPVQIGDIIGIFKTGAYGHSMSMVEFLSHPCPAEVLILDGQDYLIRRKGNFDNISGEPLVLEI